MSITLKVILVMSLSFHFFNSMAQMDWIDFGNGIDGQEPEIDMYSNSSFSVDFYGVYRYFKSENDTVYDVLKLPGNNAKTEDFGSPLLPAKTCYIELTVDTPTISINSEDFSIIDNFYLWPAQDEKEMWEEATLPQFDKNDSIYNLNHFYPENVVKTRLPKNIRGHKIASIAFFPIQFNSVTKQLKVYRNIDVTIHGAGSIETNYDNSHYDAFLSNLVINYVPDSDPDYNIDLMIITPDEYYNTLLPFKDWKEKAGIRTKIVTREDLETNDPPYEWIADPTEENWEYEGIDKYIHDFYNAEPELAPEFLLLVGETDPETPYIPTHYWFSDLEPYLG